MLLHVFHSNWSPHNPHTLYDWAAQNLKVGLPIYFDFDQNVSLLLFLQQILEVTEIFWKYDKFVSTYYKGYILWNLKSKEILFRKLTGHSSSNLYERIQYNKIFGFVYFLTIIVLGRTKMKIMETEGEQKNFVIGVQFI